MDNNLCPCSKLDWTGFDMTQPHHPDCEVNKGATHYMWNTPEQAEANTLCRAIGAIPFDGSPDHLYIRLTDGNGNHSPTYKVKVSPAQDDADYSAPWIYPAQLNPSQHSIEFTHCGVKTFLTFSSPTFKANCSVCGEALFSRSGA